MSDQNEHVIQTEHEEERSRFRTYKSTQIIWFVFGLIEALLGLRFLFKLVGANPQNAFASLLYSVTDLLLAPFASLAGAPSSNGMVLELSTLLAMLIYALIGWALERLIYVIFYKPKDTI